MTKNQIYGSESSKYIMTRLRHVRYDVNPDNPVKASVMGSPKQFLQFSPNGDSAEFKTGRAVIAFYEGKNLVGITLDDNRPKWVKN